MLRQKRDVRTSGPPVGLQQKRDVRTSVKWKYGVFHCSICTSVRRGNVPNARTYTHTHTHAYINARARTRTHTCTVICARTSACRHTHACTCSRSNVNDKERPHLSTPILNTAVWRTGTPRRTIDRIYSDSKPLLGRKKGYRHTAD